MNTKVGEVILTELKKLYTRTYFDRAPRGTTFPFVVFSTPSSFQNQDGAMTIVLRINIYDNTGNSISTLETTTEKIKKGLQKKVYTDANMMLFFRCESILQIPNTNENIRQRELTFSVKYYDREV